MIFGILRLGVIIIGVLFLGLLRLFVVEFLFYLVIFIMFGVIVLKFFKNGLVFIEMEWFYLVLGFVIVFVVVYIVIKWFMDFIKKRSFVLFGLYRIILGIIVIVLLY